MATRITVDYEFGDETWWNAAREATDAPTAVRPILHSYQDEIIVSNEESVGIEEWCSTLPGWDEGEEYADHPLLFNPDEFSEED